MLRPVIGYSRASARLVYITWPTMGRRNNITFILKFNILISTHLCSLLLIIGHSSASARAARTHALLWSATHDLPHSDAKCAHCPRALLGCRSIPLAASQQCANNRLRLLSITFGCLIKTASKPHQKRKARARALFIIKMRAGR